MVPNCRRAPWRPASRSKRGPWSWKVWQSSAWPSRRKRTKTRQNAWKRWEWAQRTRRRGVAWKCGPRPRWPWRRCSKWRGPWRKHPKPTNREQRTQHRPGHAHGALWHAQRQLGKVASLPQGMGWHGREAEGKAGGMFGAFGIFQKHSFTHTLVSSAETVLFKAVCPHSGLD